jgi:2-oxoglutarate dehydrogenase complex dehydrogenase (E1) component-like enzyme
MAVNLPDQVKALASGGRTLRRVSRASAASPAAGSHHTHEVEQQNLLDDVFS